MHLPKKIDKNIIPTTILIIAILGSFLASARAINNIAVDGCQQRISEETQKFADSVKEKLQENQHCLELLATTIDTTKIDEIITTIDLNNNLSNLGIIYPNNQIVLKQTDNSLMQNFDFQTELSKTTLVSRTVDKNYIYQTAPIVRNEQIIGIVCGFTDLKELPQLFTITSYNNQVNLFIVDGNTGDFIMDTWHDELGNINDEQFAIRDVKKGYDFKKMKDDQKKGKAGQIVFHSNNANEYMYANYQAVGIDKLTVQLSVLESVAFVDVQDIKRILTFLTVGEVFILLVYCYWLYATGKKENLLKEQQLSQSFYMYDVQQILFEAHRNPQLIEVALKKVATILVAKGTFIMTLEDLMVKQFYCWPSSNELSQNLLLEKNIQVVFPKIISELLQHKTVILNHNDVALMDGSEKIVFNKYSIDSFMVVPVFDGNECLKGILGGFNIPDDQLDTTILECVVRNFMMALNNLDSHRLIEKMGIIDGLTGLKNRNCYEYSLSQYEKYVDSSLGCVYLDVNGLHELNNHLGHVAGDKLLMVVGEAIKKYFGSEDSYRTGGDEFIIFCRNELKGTIQMRIDSLVQYINDHGYQISVGLAWQKDSWLIDSLVREAEKKMYEVKQHFYKEKGNETKIREHNLKLDQILQEKKDADTFLSIISPYFLGVYVVNLDTGIARVIYEPSYFAMFLKQNEDCFIKAISAYIKTYVHLDDQASFYDLVNYESINDILKNQESIEYHYRKSDGKEVRLRICRSDDGSTDKETFWLFEEYSG